MKNSRIAASAWVEKAAVFVMLALIVVQVAGAARYMSLTVDETAHLPAGYSYWKTRDFRLGRENPPLIKLIASAPLLFLNPRLPTEHPSWRQFDQFAFGKVFLFDSNRDADQMLLWGRIPILLLSLLLAFFVFKWSRELYGKAAGLFALFFYALEPNLLAHSSLATLDLGLTLFFFVGVYFFWRFLREPTGKTLVFAGITLGLALAAKFSAVILLPAYLILVLVACLKSGNVQWSMKPLVLWRPGVSKGRRALLFFLCLLLMVLLSFTVIFASYGFRVGPLVSSIEPAGKHTLAWRERLLKGEASPFLYWLVYRLPVPAAEWFRGFVSQTLHAEEGHDAFLMGKYSRHGWWYYYPVAFVLKTPIPLLILIIVSLLFTKGRGQEGALNEYFLIVPAALVLLAGILSKIDIGIRYILPLYPFLIVMASKVVEKRRGLVFAVFVTLLSFWYFASAVSVYPHYLAYFNELAGGPNNGYKYLVDSNLDWGQDLKGLKRYVEENNISKVKLSYFGFASPEYYKIPYEKISREEEHRFTPGIYAISATELQNAVVGDKTRFAWIKKYRPKDKIGYSIFIYEVK